MKLLQILSEHRKPVLITIGALLLITTFFIGMRLAGSAINAHRIGTLEAEKQQLLKAGAESRDRELILQGQVKAKDQQIADLTSRISESNERVSNAHNETQSAKANLNKVRSDPPKFNSTDDAGRVVELRTKLRELYPDQP